MDARLLEKCKLRVKDDFVTDKDMTAAISERFEEVVQELIESAGMQYEVHPKLNGKEPDGAIYHDSGTTYVEAVCAQGPDQLREKKGEVDLCLLASPNLIEASLHATIQYETTERDEWDIERTCSAKELTDPLSRADAESMIDQVTILTQAETDQSGGWKGEIEIKGRRLIAYIDPHTHEYKSQHIGHCKCAVFFAKGTSSSGHVSEQHISDRERILRKIKKYTPQTLNGHPLIVALCSNNSWGHDMAAEIAYGTTYSSINLAENPVTGETETVGVKQILMPDGIWCDEKGNHKRHLAAIWIFDSWDTANNLPLLAINPFLKDEEAYKAIPKRIRDVSVVCWPKPDGKLFT